MLARSGAFAAPILGGFIFAYGFVALFTLAVFGLGMRFFEAWTLSNLLSFTVYLVAIVWGFSARRTALVWLVLGGGGLAMSGAAWLLSRAMA